MLKVRSLKRNQIDNARWDQAIRDAANSLTYAYTWYLDALCPRWMGLVAGDYEYVMPMPLGRKWGIPYVYQPLFCQQLGVFYKKRDEEIIDLMLAIPLRRFIFVNININYDNMAVSGPQSAVHSPLPDARPGLFQRFLSAKKNLVLPLTREHSAIQKQYSDNTIRNIKKGIKAGLRFEIGDKAGFEAFTELYIKHTMHKDSTFRHWHLQALRQLVAQFAEHDCGRLYVARTTDGAICAGLILVESRDRIIHLLPMADEYARRSGGMHFLVDAVLAHYAGSGRIYDFEGSSVESVARFYEGFGAVNQPFQMIQKSFSFL